MQTKNEGFVSLCMLLLNLDHYKQELHLQYKTADMHGEDNSKIQSIQSKSIISLDDNPCIPR